MTRELLAEPTSFKSDEQIVTPYMRARQEWDDRIGAATVQAKNWRRAFFGAISGCLILSGGMTYLAMQTRVVPIVITVDKARGEPTVLGRVDQLSYQPGPMEIK